MRFPLALLALSLGGCAAATGAGTVQPDAGTSTRIHKMGTGIDVAAVNDAEPVGTNVPAGVDSAWAALPRAYTALGIPLTRHDAATHTAGNDNFRPPRIWRGERLSTYLDCGMAGQAGVPGADLYTVRMTVQSRVVPAGDGSRVETTVTGAARNMDGTGSADLHCVSTGKLENALAAAVALNLGS